MKRMFTVRIEDQDSVYTRVAVYNYGGKSGTLTINTSDVDEFIRRICGGALIKQDAGIVTGTMVGAVIGKLG